MFQKLILCVYRTAIWAHRVTDDHRPGACVDPGSGFFSPSYTIFIKKRRRFYQRYNGYAVATYTPPVDLAIEASAFFLWILNRMVKRSLIQDLRMHLVYGHRSPCVLIIASERKHIFSMFLEFNPQVQLRLCIV
jgi:hypothetical protein